MTISFSDMMHGSTECKVGEKVLGLRNDDLLLRHDAREHCMQGGREGKRASSQDLRHIRGALTTTVVMANSDAVTLKPEGGHDPSSGTHPSHCVDAMADPTLSMVCLISLFSRGAIPIGMISPFLYWVREPSSPSSVRMWNLQPSSSLYCPKQPF